MPQFSLRHVFSSTSGNSLHSGYHFLNVYLILSGSALFLTVHPHQDFSAPGAVPCRVFPQSRRDIYSLPGTKSPNSFFRSLCLLSKLIPALKAGADTLCHALLHLCSTIQALHDFSSVSATFPSSRLLYISDSAQNDFQKINIIG